METVKVKTTMKLGSETNSLTNWLMSAGDVGTPKVGEGATEFMWTDRHAFTVTSVSADGKQCTIVEDDAKPLHQGMTDAQNYEYSFNPSNKVRLLVFKWGAWREYLGRAYDKPYPKINIKFGIRSKYYDYSF